MKKAKHALFIALIVPFLLLACSRVPVTGRNQLRLIPDSSMLSMSLRQYDEFLKTHKGSRGQGQTQMVQSVGKRLARAVEEYFAEQNMYQDLKNYNWEFNLVDDEEVNAWCMPGGKVVVYTGILPITKDEDGLAVVIGHEIGHAVARHGNERVSHALAVQMGGVALSAALQNCPATTQELWVRAFGIGSQYGMVLPYSRLQENEADYLGLVFMAKAGYNPYKAIDFWQRMMKEKKGKGLPEFMSTHPADETRIENMRRSIPEVMRYYKKRY